MSLTFSSDTIYALASGVGLAGVAVIRVSGTHAVKGLRALSSRENFKDRHATFLKLRDPVSRETLDEAVVVVFRAPASFTGEDVVEYHLHGGRAVIQSVVEVLSRQSGHRMAEPGEFTRRAYQNGKMDLVQAEALNDLIHAQTQHQKLQAQNQMGGALSDLYNGWAETLKKSLAYLEADLDFPDEDLPEGAIAAVRPKLETLMGDIKIHLDDHNRGERLRDGIKIVILGAPNAGKSSLLNAIARRDVAIVSDVAGTTRDVLDVHLDLNGYPAILSDTAGLRPQDLGTSDHDKIEAEGMRRALNVAKEADIRILVFNAEDLPNLNTHTKDLIRDQDVVVFNKMDLTSTKPESQGFEVSVSENRGLDDLLKVLTAKVSDFFERQSGPALTRERHREALNHALDLIEKSMMSADLPELVAEDIRLAMRAIGRITGQVDVEDLLDVIFKDFCIGK